MTEYYITMDSFGSDCPSNWEEIADYLNAKIDCIDPESDTVREQVDSIFDAYLHGEYADAPEPQE